MIRRVLRRIYRRAFVERIQAILQRIDAVTYEVTLLRGEIEALRGDLQNLGSVMQQLQTEQRALERQVETALASGWDSTALARRLATLEDRIPGS